jgi:hypothetical protein
MEKLEKYRTYIEQLLTKYGSYKPAYGDVEKQLLFDRERDHYQLCMFGWEGEQRVRGCLLHLDIKQGQIWLQHDSTESNIATELVALGVPKEDLVLAFHPPYLRPYTDFATG